MTTPPLPPRERPPARSAFAWRRIVGLNVAVSLFVTILIWSLQPSVPPRGLIGTLAFCLAFTNVFGTPAAWALARVAPLTERLSPRWRLAIIALQIVAVTIPGVAVGILSMQQLGLARPESFWTDYVTGLRIGLVVALTVGLGFYFWEARREELAQARHLLHERELAEAHVRRQLAEARLASLESRLRPHFLFNTLNSIAALIPENPRLAEETVERLAALLRFTLETGDRRVVPLSVELAVVTAYLEIERARFGERLRFALDVADSARSAAIPPLAVQTLVENVVKHAVAPGVAGATVRLSARLDADRLRVVVEDDGPGFAATGVPEGHGLANLRERLRTLFGDAAQLELGPAASGGARVALALPAGEVAP